MHLAVRCVQLSTDIDVISVCVLTLFNYFLFFLIVCVCCYHLMVNKDEGVPSSVLMQQLLGTRDRRVWKCVESGQC